LPGTAFALTNADDKRGMVVLQNTAATKLTYGFKTLATFRGKIMENSLEGLQLLIDDKEVFFRMVGEFNAYNLLAVYGASVALGEDKDAVLLSLSNLEGAEGRFERVQSDYKKVLGIVDYAHTPDALLNVLVTVNRVRDGKGKLITVVGCGGNRDKSKRPLMGAVACEYSDKVVFTSDNPRNEDAEEIIREMEVGVKITQRKKYVSITDRKEAIKVAVSMSEPHDVVLVAGKGHEKYQEVKGVKFEFDDKTVLAEMLHMFEK
jgi:UDP-N-acetylmuramoyl-L-alanyl-D-glutamate--2,6-diaminopimelate ligase